MYSWLYIECNFPDGNSNMPVGHEWNDVDQQLFGKMKEQLKKEKQKPSHHNTADSMA